MSNLFSAIRLPFTVAVGTAVGSGVAGAIEPTVQEIVNLTWSENAVKPPSYFMLAEGVAKGRVDPAWARDRAAEQGIGNDAFTRLTQIANIGTGIDVGFELWRRNLITDGDFDRLVGEESIEAGWLGPLRGLKERLLTPAELANARQQEFIDDARLTSEGALQGYDAERMNLMYLMAGLPPGVMEGLEMLRRGIIDETTYRQLVAEGHTKTKYTDNLLALKTHVLSGYEAAGLRLRGWISAQESYRLGALDGWAPAEMDYLYLNRGRPAAPGQMWTAITRGIDGPDGKPMDEAQFMKGIQESDIRPEWGKMLYDIRFLYPSLFQLQRLVSSGAIDPTTAADWATKARYAPEVVDALVASWTGQSAGGGAKWAGRAQSRLYTVAHNEYVSMGIDEAAARTALGQAGVSAAEQTEVIRIWNEERTISRLELTPAEIRREYKKNVIPLSEALTELEDRGMTTEDATRYLQQGPQPPT